MLTVQKTNGRSNITLALDSHVLDEIRKIASMHSTSVNSLINDILLKHVFFYKYAEEQKSVVIPSRSYSLMLKTMDEEKQIELMKRISLEIIPSIFTHHNLPFTVSNLIKYCFEGIGLWAGTYNIFSHHTDEKGNLCLVFEHAFGMKWSRIIAESISYFIENTLNCSTEKKIMTNIVVIKILDKNNFHRFESSSQR